MSLQNNSPDNGSMWQLSGNTPSFFASTIGDMAFRLHGGVRNVAQPPCIARLRTCWPWFDAETQSII